MKYIEIGRLAYQLTESCSIQTTITGYDIDEPLFSLSPDGLLTLKIHFAWDGPSGAVNTRSFIISSGYHDALCKMINRALLPVEEQCKADGLMDAINDMPQIWTDGEDQKEVQMGTFRRLYAYVSVRVFQRNKKKEEDCRSRVFEINLLPQ